VKKLIGYIRTFLREELNLIHLLLCVLLITSALIWAYASAEKFHFTGAASAAGFPFLRNMLVYGLAFALPLVFYFITKQHREALLNPKLWGLVLFAVLIFSYKVYANSHKIWVRQHIDGSEAIFWQRIVGHVGSFVILVVPVFLYWLFFNRKSEPFYGLSVKQFDIRPYLLVLGILIPLVFLAATQPDFLKQYPKVTRVLNLAHIETNRVGYGALFEASYGLDFIATEIFFRGFLILAFVRLLGRGAILPMAVFYVAIHLGKPLGECISSFFGGALLGIFALETRSIWGGVLLHLGIAWIMELAGVWMS
jgi:hypothetical protein